NYVRIAVRALRTYRPEHYTITTEAGRIEVSALMVTIANSAQFGNGARIAPGARVDDGQLDLVIVQETSRWQTVTQLPRLFNRTVDRMPGCSIRRVESATIACDRPILFHVDGEPLHGGTCMRARIHAGALLVAVR